jgi:biotin carboxyl carrier protein
VNFRFKALAKLREPDELDTPTVLTSARGWVTLLALTAVTAAAIAWAVFARLPQTVSADGLITPPNGAAQVQSQYAGVVLEIHANDGGQVRPGQELAVVRDAQGASHAIISVFVGQVISVEVAQGQVISVGTTVATIERGGPGAQLVAMLFVASSQSAGVVPGESVGLSVASAPAAAFGLLHGRVLSVSRFPLTAPEISALLGGTIPAGSLAADGGKLLVTVSLAKDRRTVSGYSWTTAAGPPQALLPLVSATGTITFGARAPITLLFGR